MDVVAAAVHAVPRGGFLPTRERSRSSHDGPIPIGHGQTNSQPRTVEAMLRLLDVRPGHRVLDVGAGSGWTTALLAELTGPTGSVLGLELVPELAQWGASNLARTSHTWAALRTVDPDVLGAPESGPYDRILVSADAGALPTALTEQLVPDGAMVGPVRGTMLLVRATESGLSVTEHGSYRFVPLVEPGTR